MVATAGHGDIPLVGRTAEIGRIDAAIAAVGDGQGRVLMLAGEPGIGKSTLARAAATRAEAAGLTVYWGFAWEAGGAPAYWPWSQVVSSLVADRRPPAVLADQLREILPGRSGPSEPVSLQPGQARFQLLESVRRLLDDCSRSAPLMLVLEDLHAADNDSLNLLQFVARHVGGMPVLLVGTYRDVEARRMPGSDALWRTCRDAEVLGLGRLDESAVREFLAARGETASDGDVRNLLVTTDGNPLFLASLIGLLSGRETGSDRLPATVQQVIGQQIGLLPAKTATLLAEASVLGREFDLASLCALTSAADPGPELAPAVEAGILRKVDDGRFRFGHLLYRDVLYRGMPDNRRRALHERYGDYLEKLISAGDDDRWSELAEHLRSAGDAHRERAVAAWRASARQAMRRLAFDDAVAALDDALSAFGSGPKRDPIERYRLLLECAEASLLAGANETGCGYCRDAFAIACTLENPAMMCDAVLTWGSVIFVAQVDADLVDALERCLAVLGDGETAQRARIRARLAGALQPAPDPAVPMAMAREAIAEARTTGDEAVLHSVLRSAISALMDFAPAGERMALNEEFGSLAERLGDVPGQFRAMLRLVIDAAELADRVAMDRAINRCGRLASRIGLPHYLWRAASLRAMQATISGEYAAAVRYLDEADELADSIDDLEAMVTIPLQRFAILADWVECDAGELADIEARLAEAYASGMAGAEFFARPFIESYKSPLDAAAAGRILANRSFIERLFASGDRYSICRVGEIAAAAGDDKIALRAYDGNRPFLANCATLGLMGSVCTGPIAASQGAIAASLGRYDEALTHLDDALAIAESMRSPPWCARIHARMAGVAQAAGDTALARRHSAAAREIVARLGLRPVQGVSGGDTERADAATPGFALERDGDLWRISYDGASTMLKNSRGLELLAELVAQPDTDVHVLDLGGGTAVRGQGTAGPALDRQARQQYEARLLDLREELDEAVSFGDDGRADAVRGEIEFLTRELAAAFGIGGRARRTGDDAERARVNVRRRLADAMGRIGKALPEAGRYLKNTIKTGSYCRYSPM